jgi:hypothetical protein
VSDLSQKLHCAVPGEILQTSLLLRERSVNFEYLLASDKPTGMRKKCGFILKDKWISFVL